MCQIDRRKQCPNCKSKRVVPIHGDQEHNTYHCCSCDSEWEVAPKDDKKRK